MVVRLRQDERGRRVLTHLANAMQPTPVFTTHSGKTRSYRHRSGCSRTHSAEFMEKLDQFGLSASLPFAALGT